MPRQSSYAISLLVQCAAHCLVAFYIFLTGQDLHQGMAAVIHLPVLLGAGSDGSTRQGLSRNVYQVRADVCFAGVCRQSSSIPGEIWFHSSPDLCCSCKTKSFAYRLLDLVAPHADCPFSSHAGTQSA